MKPANLCLFVVLFSSGVCFAQTDSLLFRSISEIISRGKKLGFEDQIFMAINKYDLDRMKIKDSTIMNVAGRNFIIILLREPTNKKDLYVLPSPLPEIIT